MLPSPTLPMTFLLLDLFDSGGGRGFLFILHPGFHPGLSILDPFGVFGITDLLN